jgi:hypothetical protein
LHATGLRRGDAIKVGRPHLRDGVSRINAEKTGERVSIAAIDDLLEAIATGPCGPGRKVAAHYTRASSGERLSLAAAKRTKKGTSIPAPDGQGAGASAESQTKSNVKK